MKIEKYHAILNNIDILNLFREVIIMIMIIKNRENGRLSKEVAIEDVIYNQSEIEFELGDFNDEDYETITYNDFLYFQDDFEVIIEDDV